MKRMAISIEPIAAALTYEATLEKDEAVLVAADRAHVVEVLDAAERIVAGRPEIELLSVRRDLRRSDD